MTKIDKKFGAIFQDRKTFNLHNMRKYSLFWLINLNVFISFAKLIMSDVFL